MSEKIMMSSQIQAKNKKNQSMLQNRSIKGTTPPFSFRWHLETANYFISRRCYILRHALNHPDRANTL